MREYLILRLQGVMQAWGGHTFEDYRPTEQFPTRSGIVGLLGAALGVDRNDVRQRESLSNSFLYAVRADNRGAIQSTVMTDFHTVLDSRMAKGNDKSNKNAVMSYREYLCDAHFTVALWQSSEQRLLDSSYPLSQLQQALQFPLYTPVLGRRSCPITQPIFEQRLSAASSRHVFSQLPPFGGTIYSEEGESDHPRMRVRDVPINSPHRQFATRDIFIIQQDPVLDQSGGEHVSQ